MKKIFACLFAVFIMAFCLNCSVLAGTQEDSIALAQIMKELWQEQLDRDLAAMEELNKAFKTGDAKIDELQKKLLSMNGHDKKGAKELADRINRIQIAMQDGAGPRKELQESIIEDELQISSIDSCIQTILMINKLEAAKKEATLWGRIRNFIVDLLPQKK